MRRSTITNTGTGFSRAATSDNAGAFLIQYLPVGNYTVDVTAQGFKKFVQQNVIIVVDVTQPLNVTLGVGVATETVTVTDTPAADQHYDLGDWPNYLTAGDE